MQLLKESKLGMKENVLFLIQYVLCRKMLCIVHILQNLVISFCLKRV